MTGFNVPPPHVRAWYSYAFASEVFAACALAIFLPITLEQMAREVGYYAPELIERCVIEDQPVDGVERVCKAKILGVWVDTASFSMYVKSIAVAVQALCIISVVPSADSPYWRKRLLLIFAYTGSLSAVLFLLFPTTPYTWTAVLAAILNIVGNATYSTSIVCANAFLPILARQDEAVQRAWHAAEQAVIGGEQQTGTSNGGYNRASLDDEASRLLPDPLLPAVRAISTQDLAESDPIHQSTDDINHDPTTHYHALLSLTTSRLSSVETAVGFFSGVSVLAVLLIPVLALGGTTFSLRLAIGLSGIWWAVFSIPSWLSLPGGNKDDSKVLQEGKVQALKEAWWKLGRMVTPDQMRQLPNLYIFLVAWAFLSDGFHTTTYVAILFASSVLSMSPAKITLVGIIVQLAAVISSILTPAIQQGLSARQGKPVSNFQVLLCGVVLSSAIPIYTSVGLVLPFGGLRTEAEMYVLAVCFGLLYGPFLSYSRAVYAELIPPNHESTFFSLFSFTDKSASFLGPAAVGLISDLSGNLRYGFIFLLIMLTVPIPVLLKVNVEQGAEEARLWANNNRDQESTGRISMDNEERQGLLNSSR